MNGYGDWLDEVEKAAKAAAQAGSTSLFGRPQTPVPNAPYSNSKLLTYAAIGGVALIAVLFLTRKKKAAA